MVVYFLENLDFLAGTDLKKWEIILCIIMRIIPIWIVQIDLNDDSKSNTTSDNF